MFVPLRGVHEIENVLEFRGTLKASWEYLSGGSFAGVYGKGKYVWKINSNAAGRYAAEVDGAKAYLLALAKGKIRSVHAPRVFRMLVDKAGRYAALMERLSAATTYRFFVAVDWIKQYAENFDFDRHDYDDYDVPDTLIRFAKLLMTTLGREYGADMHRYNAMLRDDVVVLTDPFAWRKDT